ncbi:MAG: hypothetical protein IT286_02130, partial [Proteobacteria bacterium]|nr:hypothetical protein [Pseudomonadota bacterium]
VSTRGTTYGSDGKIVLSLEMIQKKTEEERKQREFSEIANQCTALVKFDDVRGRNLIQKTFNIERTKSSYTSQQMESFKDSIQKKYEANDFSSYVMMYSILNISMNTSLYTMMIFREMFLGPKTKSDLQTYFGQSATFGSETVKNETYRKAAGRMISAFIAERAKTPIPSMEGPNLDSEIQAFNGNIQKINDICNQARKFYKNTAASYNGTATLGFMTPKDSLAKYTSDQYFIKIYGEQTEGYLKALRDSKLGILLFSDSFREKVGSFDAKACSQEAVGLTTDPITKSDIMTGVDEVRTTFIHLIKDAVKDYASAKPAEVVEKYIQAFPLTVQKVMIFTKSKEDALLACGVIEDIYSDDYWMDKFDMGLMIGGVSAGVICAATGMGVPASAAIMGTFTVADMASGGVKWAKGYTLENAVRGAGVSGQTEHVKGQEDLQKAKALKSEGQLQVGLSAAGEFGGYFGTKGFIYLRNTYRTKLARDFFKTQDVQVVSYIESIFSKPKYSQIDSNHLAQVLEDAKKANEYSGVPAKLKALGLDDIDAKEVTRMVSQANEERLIFDELQGVIAQKKYAGKEKEAIVILHSVAKKGSVMRAGPAISYNSNERIDALIKARKYLIKLGFEADDVTKMMDELFNENTGALLGKIEKAEVGKFGAYSTKNPDATDLVIHGKKTPWVQSTVDEAKDLIKHKYTSPGDFFAIREKFKKGGTIQFGNGKVFSIKSIYDDTGARNTILELDSGRLLRIPKKQTFGLNDSPSSFISGHQVLEGAGVPIVKVFEHSHDYVLVEKLTNSRNIRNYTHYLEVRNELPELARKKMDADFLKFAQKTKNVEYVGDFSGEQIVYSDHRGWVLADITDDVRVFDGKGNMTVFDSEIFAKYTPDEMVEKFREAVHKSRLSVKPNVASEA